MKLDGRETILFVCPRCGEAGHCVEHESTFVGTAIVGSKLTMAPSLVCSCGGHYWLTDGVPRED